MQLNITLRDIESSAKRRAGFTLIELMIAIGILLILTTLSVAVFSNTASADRIRSSARQVQSAFGGARDRALKAGRQNASAQVGLRLMLDANDQSLVTTFVYVQHDDNWTQGTVIVGRPDNPNGKPSGSATGPLVRTVRGYGTNWSDLYLQGLIANGTRIRIPANGEWYTIDCSYLPAPTSNWPEVLTLTKDFDQVPQYAYQAAGLPNQGADGGWGIWNVDDDQDGMTDNISEAGWYNSDDANDANPLFTGNLPQSYSLELLSSVLPGQEPMRLSSGIAIDLDFSVLPKGWRQSTTLPKGSPLPTALNGYGNWTVAYPDSGNGANDIYTSYLGYMDVMFSPRGGVTGPLSAQGLIHLRLANTDDIAQSRLPSDPAAAPMLYSTLFTQTGYVATFPVDTTGNPLKFALTGSTVGR
jgi:prepilin-type N-terminal cleavage/methylation domain-containing protein